MLTIFDIKRFALHDGPGIRTTVFMKGCPLQCIWCHNPESQSVNKEEYTIKRVVDDKEITLSRVYGKEIDQQTLIAEILKDKVFFEESKGGVTFSGGEPLMQAKDLVMLLKELGKENLHRAVDTSGYANWNVLSEVADETDLFLYDLKLMDSKKHKELTGVENQRILQNADSLLEGGSNVIFRIPVIPGINDGEEEMSAFMEFFSARNKRIEDVHLLPYHEIALHKYGRMKKKYSVTNIDEPTEDHMQVLKQKIESCGVNVTIGG